MNLDSVIDLSHVIVPEREEYGCTLTIRNIEEVLPKYKRAPDAWYVIGHVAMNTHCGTHVEAPFHHCREGMDIAALPLDRLIGPAACIDVTDFRNNQQITLQDIIERAGALRSGDAVLFDCGVAGNYGTERGHERPWFAPEAIRWLVDEKRVWAVGTDATGVEVRTPSGGSTGRQPNHEYLLGHGVPLIESLTNLTGLRGLRFTLMVLPVKMKGAESFPARVIAIKDEG